MVLAGPNSSSDSWETSNEGILVLMTHPQHHCMGHGEQAAGVHTYTHRKYSPNSTHSANNSCEDTSCANYMQDSTHSSNAKQLMCTCNARANTKHVHTHHMTHTSSDNVYKQHRPHGAHATLMTHVYIQEYGSCTNASHTNYAHTVHTAHTINAH